MTTNFAGKLHVRVSKSRRPTVEAMTRRPGSADVIGHIDLSVGELEHITGLDRFQIRRLVQDGQIDSPRHGIVRIDILRDDKWNGWTLEAAREAVLARLAEPPCPKSDRPKPEREVEPAAETRPTGPFSTVGALAKMRREADGNEVRESAKAWGIDYEQGFVVDDGKVSRIRPADTRFHMEVGTDEDGIPYSALVEESDEPQASPVSELAELYAIPTKRVAELLAEHHAPINKAGVDAEWLASDEGAQFQEACLRLSKQNGGMRILSKAP